MKNKVFKLVTMCLVSVILFAVPTFAGEKDLSEMHSISVQTEKETVGMQKATTRVIGNTRGTYFSVATISIENPEPGVIGINADVMCSQDVDKITIKMFLDVKMNGKWSQLKSWSSETLNNAVAGKYVEYTNFNSGYEYRARGSFFVYEGNNRETANGQTDSLVCE